MPNFTSGEVLYVSPVGPDTMLSRRPCFLLIPAPDSQFIFCSPHPIAVKYLIIINSIVKLLLQCMDCSQAICTFWERTTTVFYGHYKVQSGVDGSILECWGPAMPKRVPKRTPNKARVKNRRIAVPSTHMFLGLMCFWG